MEGPGQKDTAVLYSTRDGDGEKLETIHQGSYPCIYVSIFRFKTGRSSMEVHVGFRFNTDAQTCGSDEIFTGMGDGGIYISANNSVSKVTEYAGHVPNIYGPCCARN